MSAESRGYRVHGRVQGVGFRWWTARTAEELGLSGTVRNLRSGAVEIHAHGAPESLAQLEDRLRSGPPGARVDRIESIAPASSFPQPGFRIVR